MNNNGEKMNNDRYWAIYKGLSSVAKKVFHSLSETQYWSIARVNNELFRNGIKLGQSEVAGCLNTLVKSGLAVEAQGTFVRVQIKEEQTKPAIQQKEDAPMVATKKPVQEKQSPVDKLLGISVKLGELSAFITGLANEITGAVEEVELFVKENDEEMQKLQQLKTLLKSLG